MLKTREVVKLLNTTYHRIMTALRGGKFPSPAKDASGDFVWAKADIERARQALSVDRRYGPRKGVHA